MKVSFFQTNRRRIMRAVDSKVAIFAGHSLVQRSNDAAYSFEQEANFWYLTGIEAPGWALIIDGTKSSLIAPDVDDVHRIFDGSLKDEVAKRISGVDEVLTHAQGQLLVNDLAKKYGSAATLGNDPRAKHYDFSLNPAPVTLHRKLRRQFKAVEDCRLVLAKLRAIKQPEEIAAIRQSVDLTVKAFNSVRDRLDTFHHEYEIEAEFSHTFRSSGAKGHAYDPIVAAGKNACTLHYGDNDAPLDRKSLILLDIGARVGGYPADITRTYALGKPTKRQEAIHQAVESAHHEIIALLRPGLSVAAYQEKVDEIMKAKLEGLGLLQSPEDYRRYFPHAISHGLGIDVHDALGRPEEFQEGMVLTVEPGIYIPEEGVGVRIEDDILITKTGRENLSAALSTSL